MALIEQIEKKSLKDAIKNKYFYLLATLFLAPLAFIQTDYNIFILGLIAIALALVFTVDAKEYIIPDTSQIALFVLANALLYLSDSRNMLESYIGFFFAAIVFGSVYYVFESVLKRPALGFGDVKLFANVGLLLGFFSFSYFLWILTILSGIYVVIRKFIFRKTGAFPYGPFIVVSAWLCLLYNNYFAELNNNIMMSLFG